MTFGRSVQHTAGTLEIVVEILGVHGAVESVLPTTLLDSIERVGRTGDQGGAWCFRASGLLQHRAKPEVVVVTGEKLGGQRL